MKTNTNIKFLIPIGISGSGKSKWIASLGDGYAIISPDDIRRELTGDVSNQTRNREVFEIAIDRAINTLNMLTNVVFDATNVTSRERRKMLNHIRNNVVVDFTAYAKVFDVDPEICKARIKKDIDNGVDRSNVPPEAIDKQYLKFNSGLKNIESDGYLLM